MRVLKQTGNLRWLLPELHPVWQYTLAFAFTTAALAIAMLLPYNETNPVLTFFLVAAAAAAWVGGGTAGVFSCFLVLTEGDYFLLRPRFSFGIAYTGDRVELLNAVAACLIAVFITTKLRNALRNNIELLEQEQAASSAVLEAQRRERELLQKEEAARLQAERNATQLTAILENMNEHRLSRSEPAASQCADFAQGSRSLRLGGQSGTGG